MTIPFTAKIFFKRHFNTIFCNLSSFEQITGRCLRRGFKTVAMRCSGIITDSVALRNTLSVFRLSAHTQADVSLLLTASSSSDENSWINANHSGWTWRKKLHKQAYEMHPDILIAVNMINELNFETEKERIIYYHMKRYCWLIVKNWCHNMERFQIFPNFISNWPINRLYQYHNICIIVKYLLLQSVADKFQ